MSLIRCKRLAIRDLDDIWLYIRADNQDAADRFIERLWVAMETLAVAPKSGVLREDLGKRMRTRPVGNYIIIYRPTSDGIEVVRILQGNRRIGADTLRRR